MTTFVERARPDPVCAAYPGFYLVRAGTLFEVGDQIMGPDGDTQSCVLEQVGQRVPEGLMVLRIDRRKETD